MKKQIISMMVFAICLLFVGVEAMAQGVAVYKKNGVVMKIPYADLDSIVTYNYGEDANNGVVQGHECVDLGLSVNWATCNMGANSPEEHGDYYAWGETSTKSEYNSSNSVTYNKENFSSISGNSQYDAARANWGGSWRIPTEEECQELIDKCKWIWTVQKGQNGYEIIGPNGNSIFLPVTGFRKDTESYDSGEGHYWSSTPARFSSIDSYYIEFDNSNYKVEFYGRDRGRSIRPVTE